MSEPVCPVRNCDPADCAKCDGLPPFEECVYVQLYRGIRSGEFQRNKSRPWKDIIGLGGIIGDFHELGDVPPPDKKEGS